MTLWILANFVLRLCSPLTPVKTNHISLNFTISYSKREKTFPSPPSCCCTWYGSRTDPSENTEADRIVRKILTMRWRSRKQYWKLCVMETHMYRDFQWCFRSLMRGTSQYKKYSWSMFSSWEPEGDFSKPMALSKRHGWEGYCASTQSYFRSTWI